MMASMGDGRLSSAPYRLGELAWRAAMAPEAICQTWPRTASGMPLRTRFLSVFRPAPFWYVLQSAIISRHF